MLLKWPRNARQISSNFYGSCETGRRCPEADRGLGRVQYPLTSNSGAAARHGQAEFDALYALAHYTYCEEKVELAVRSANLSR